MRQSQILSTLSLCVTLLYITACGGGPGGQLSPETTPDMQANRSQASRSNDPYTPKPKPKINRDAKQLFSLAGQVASRANPDYDRALELYRDAYNKDKKLTLALYNAGLISELKGDENQARQFYESLAMSTFCFPCNR